MNLPAMHFVPSDFLRPTNPLTVNLIGAGGTGSQVLTALAKMNHAMIALGHPGLQVSVWDDDQVSEANLGRQLFAESELGLCKSVALINRINRFFGTNWKAVPKRYNRDTCGKHHANLCISCVDSAKARRDIAAVLLWLRNERYGLKRGLYWLDFGNGQHSGQVFLSTIQELDQPTSKLYQPVAKLPFITEEYATELQEADKDDLPSCSLAEALTKQDLFINSTLANMGSGLLWKLFRNGMIEYRGFFLNLANFRSQPVPVA